MKWLNGYRIRLMLIGLIISGFLSTASVCPAQEYTWTQKSDMPTPRWNLSASAVNGKIYAIGGASSEPGKVVLSTVEEYDPTTDNWTRKADMPTARTNLSTSVVSGKIYAIGGGKERVYAVEVYDPTTDTWTQKDDLPTKREGLSTSVVEGKIYVIGGLSPGGEFLGTVEVYDPATDTWTVKADMPTPRLVPSSSVVNGKIYAIGGWPVGGGGGCGIVEAYDPATDTWTAKADMPTARMTSTSVVCGKIYAIGGWRHSAQGPLYSTVEVYDPATDTWTKEGDMPVARAGLSTSVVNNRIYVIGGTDRPHPCPATSTVYELVISGPPPDFNGDGIVDSADMCIMVDHWGEDYSLCDIGPMPWGDGIVDVQDLIVLAEYLFTYPGAIAYWKLDETEGDIAYDSVAENDAVVFGDAVWQPEGGKVDGALQFDGIDDYVSTPFILDPADAVFSVVAWVKGTTPGQVIISQTGGTNWLLADPAEGKLRTSLLRPGGGRTAPQPLISEFIITDGNWHRIGLVWDGYNRILYADGVEVATDAQTGLGSSDGGLYIGAGSTLDAASFFSGLIDDVRIYDRAITP